MRSSEFREGLAARISPEEKEMLRMSDPELYISDFNRSVCMRVIEPEQPAAAGRESTVDPEVDLESAEELEENLRTFLDEYMSDHPEAHKWIILSCLELTFVEKQPMHPQKSAKWVSRDGHYYCPSMNKDSIICRYCTCEEEPDNSRGGTMCCVRK